MQRRGCDEAQLLISKYADGEATSDEKEVVERHVAACEGCACKLLEYMEVAAIFSEVPVRAPDPDLRAGVFRQIGQIKEEERRRERAAAERGRWRVPAPVSRLAVQSSSFVSRLAKAASPFAAAGVAVVVFLWMMVLADRLGIENTGPQPTVVSEPSDLPYVPVPTLPATAVAAAVDDIPPPVFTKTANHTPIKAASPIAVSATSNGEMLELEQPVPAMETGDAHRLADWHALRDPAYGYTIYYPPNWWTQVDGNTRSFFPWQEGGMRYRPYWIELTVQDNAQRLTVDAANQVLLDGLGEPQSATGCNPYCLRHHHSDSDNRYDELYKVEPERIYVLRAVIPTESTYDFLERWDEVQSVFTRMTGKFSTPLVSSGEEASTSAAPVLFLKGTDLYAVDLDGGNPRLIVHGYGVRQFVLSSDMRQVAFASTTDTQKVWADNVYLITIDNSQDRLSPTLVWSGDEAHDIAWYGSRELLVLGKQIGYDSIGIFRLPATAARTEAATNQSTQPEAIAILDDNFVGARGLAVSPDRQLITFLAPLGIDKGTDIYAVRPDGSDLRLLVSHTTPASPMLGNERIFSAEGQAIKSYTWIDGHLESGGYACNILFTCGDDYSPTLYRGGFLYSKASAAQGPVFDASQFTVDEPHAVQIVHVAYSPSGKVAFTGYYNLREPYVEVLAGLWTADLVDGVVTNIKSWPDAIPRSPQGIADLQWSPDGQSLIYRETTPTAGTGLVSRYDGLYPAPFAIVKLDLATGEKSTLYNAR